MMRFRSPSVRQRGKKREEAAYEGGCSFRPIMMTTMRRAIGGVAIGFRLGFGSELRRSVGIGHGRRLIFRPGANAHT